MLAYLRVRGLALLDDVAVEFAPGMNVLTGETGAGKSIIVGALSLLRGGRARADMVRDGTESAVVDAQFDPGRPALDRLELWLDERGLPRETSDGIVIQRVVPRTGRGRSFVQGSLTTQGMLGELGEELIDICSQHEHHFLTHTARHLDVLDAYANLGEARERYAERYRAWQVAVEDLRALEAKTRDGQQRADYLRFQVEEIERVGPEVGEYDTLRRRLGLLRQAHRWAEFARDAHGLLYDNDDAIAARLAMLSERARGGSEESTHLAAIQEQLEAAQIACEEAARTAATFAMELEIDPMELEAAEERLHDLEALRRKHHVDVDELAARAIVMRDELDAIEHADERLAALGDRCDDLENAARVSAQALHDARTQAAAGLARAVEAELAALHLEAARLEVSLHATGTLGPTGADAVEFLFSANTGESMAPLRKVASGGELSRVLLAIKGVLAVGDRVATYVFDEVDAGVGGAVAESIGRRLKRASAEHQVLCITHLPQIAAFADRHYRVEKKARDGRTTTSVVELTEAERVEELARMLAGKRVSESAREHARELILAAKDGARRGSSSATGSAARRSEGRPPEK